MEENISEAVLTEVTRLAGGDAMKARQWYFDIALPEFDGKTAAAAVAAGREADVLRLLDMYEAGWLG